MKKRVVITGIGVVSSNGIGVNEFEQALRRGRSGIKRHDELASLNFKCLIGGIPDIHKLNLTELLPPVLASKVGNKAVLYACLSGIEAWKDAGLRQYEEKIDFDSGMVMGAGSLLSDSFINKEYPVYLIDKGQHKKLRSIGVTESMNSGAAAYLNAILGLGNRVQSNSSACITGSEAVLMGYEQIASGRAKRMLCGSTEGDGKYIWGAFDSMRVLCSDSNDRPAFGSRPMSSTSSGFVPSGGSGALVLESLESAEKRGAKIYAEILGGHINSGGHRNGGSMTAPNGEAVAKCIKQAISESNISPKEIDLINGHLTSTGEDPNEIRSWVSALNVSYTDFPMINTPKSMIGHALAGAGSIELVASVLQIHNDFIHSNLNTEEIHPDIQKLISPECIPSQCLDKKVNILVKANFAFGDLNCAIVLRKFHQI